MTKVIRAYVAVSFRPGATLQPIDYYEAEDAILFHVVSKFVGDSTAKDKPMFMLSAIREHVEQVLNQDINDSDFRASVQQALNTLVKAKVLAQGLFGEDVIPMYHIIPPGYIEEVDADKLD